MAGEEELRCLERDKEGDAVEQLIDPSAVGRRGVDKQRTRNWRGQGAPAVTDRNEKREGKDWGVQEGSCARKRPSEREEERERRRRGQQQTKLLRRPP